MSHIDYYRLTPEQTTEELKTSLQGLSETERASRIAVYGSNALQVQAGTSKLESFLNQFKDLMVILLIVSAGFSVYLEDYRTASILAIIIVVNIGVGYYQEAKAENILAKLKTMVHSSAKVKIDGSLKEVPTDSLVPGDVVYLQEGDSVPADLRIFEEMNLQSNDFALTGESNPQKKHRHAIEGQAELGDRTNMAFMGTTIATGDGRGIVVHTGNRTELGNIANLAHDVANELSPLQQELNHTSKNLTIGALILGGALFLVALKMHMSIHEAILFALGIASSMVPQGLPSQISVALTSASARLAVMNALVKKLSAVETIGAINVICTDKTGTLTKNEMTVQKVLIGKQVYDITGDGYEPMGTMVDENGRPVAVDEMKQLFFAIGLCASNARISGPDKEHATWYTVGDPTEGALITLADKLGLDQVYRNDTYPEVHEFSFDSVRKMMSSIRVTGNQKQVTGTGDTGYLVPATRYKYRVYVKGAFTSIIERCSHIYTGSEVHEPISQKEKDFLASHDMKYASQAMRNLAFAYKDLDHRDESMTMEEIESDLTFMGMVSMIDPPRASVPAAMQAARDAHIKVVIVTGDYEVTARAIAERIQLTTDPEKLVIVNGAILRTMTDIAVVDVLKNSEGVVFSRVSPEDKVRIVGLCKDLGRITAVTGDGVNDAPALKKADIGVAMGKTGTDVSKDAAEIVLLDDKFSTLVSAVGEGRRIYNNLKNIVLSCITTNGSELFTVLASIATNLTLGRPMAISAVQILAIDLIGEMGPLAAIAWDPARKNIMTEQPRDTSKHILARKSIIDLIFSGFLMGGLAYLAYWFNIYLGGVAMTDLDTNSRLYMSGTTMCYLVIILGQWGNILSRRAGDESVFSRFAFSNKQLLIAYGISAFCFINLIWNPWINHIFGFAPLNLMQVLICVVFAFVYTAVKEWYKTKNFLFLAI